jgi:hypothetical protein
LIRGTIVLQNCANLLKVVPESCSETCVTSSHFGNQVIDIKVEDVTDMQEEENSLLLKFPAIKAEHEVSSMSLFTVHC